MKKKNLLIMLFIVCFSKNMAIKNVTIAIILLMMTGSISSCTNDNVDEDFNFNPKEKIIGKWKLIRSTHPWSGQSFDYSKCEVVYEFRPDSILITSGECIERFAYPPNEYGYYYSFVKDEEELGFTGIVLLPESWKLMASQMMAVLIIL